MPQKGGDGIPQSRSCQYEKCERTFIRILPRGNKQQTRAAEIAASAAHSCAITADSNSPQTGFSLRDFDFIPKAAGTPGPAPARVASIILSSYIIKNEI
jgi:hypothetical protein